MKTDQIIYVCSNCGEEYLRWQGKCDNCGQWNTLKEFRTQKSKYQIDKSEFSSGPVELSKVQIKNFQRISTKISEVDRVLGGPSTGSTSSLQAGSGQGGIVPGSVILLGGEPGIGKSTLVMQIAQKLDNVLYVSGEESAEQIKMRADRLKMKSNNIKISLETNINSLLAILENNSKPSLIIIDSIQTIYSENFPSTAGSLVQVRECALRLQQMAKSANIPVILIGHVTKEGSVAGPKTLEHMVDVVLYLEGERFHETRILRTTKNRFGATDEIGIFEIGTEGLIEVKNPSKIFLENRGKTPGSVVTAAIEGTRPLLVEIQALTSSTSFGYPKRTASGFDLNRLNLIIAILINRGGLNLASSDVYLNVAGGLYLKEPAIDLAVAAAIISSFKNIKIDSKTLIFGELSLGGEIRPVNFAVKRISEGKRLGFTKIIKSRNIQEVIKEIFNA